MYLGIDLGTSAIKAVLVDDYANIVAEGVLALSISRPRQNWSEQNAADFWAAACAVIDQLKVQYPVEISQVRGIGLSGQMHGAVLLDEKNTPLRPVILWNDGRSAAQSQSLNDRHPNLAMVVGVPAMPGFTAPKLMWLKAHEPEVFAKISCILLPKDYIRLKLTGIKATDMSDAAGTWWLDQANRKWSAEALDATFIRPSQLPLLLEGNTPSGVLLQTLAARWGMGKNVIVASGAGDAASGAVGLGAINDGDAFISLGTSGQLFVATNSYRPAPSTMVHAFAHAIPNIWLQMAAMLNGASPLAWGADLFGMTPASLADIAEAGFKGPASLQFLPYLSGERTPHNNPDAKGVFFGLTSNSGHAEFGQSIMEGVAYTFADALKAVLDAGTNITKAGVIGGGSRSKFWVQILSNVMQIELIRYVGADKGPAFGASRLARMAVTSETPRDVCIRPEIKDIISPQAELVAAYLPKIERFRRLYHALKSEF